MKLLVDIGNHSVKWIVMSNHVTAATLSHIKGNAHQFAWQENQFTQQLDQHWQALPTVKSIIVSNVAGTKIANMLQQWAQTQLHLDVIFASTQKQQLGVRNGYEHYQQLGIDRWLLMIAAAKIYPGQNVCVIGSGSAITVDVINSQAQHLGGWIIPGVSMMRKSLITGTAHIQLQEGDSDPATPGTSTTACVNNGTSIAANAFVEKIIKQMQRKFSDDLLLIGTGGAIHSTIEQIEPHNIQIEPDMVLKGLALVSES